MITNLNESTNDKQNNVVLKEVHIDGNICGEYIEFSMNSVYENRGKTDINAVYTFPIPDTAVLTGFEVNIGGRTIISQVEDKHEAVRIYNEAVGKGIYTFELEQYKDNVFRITIGQILPGAKVKIKISYMDQLAYEDDCLKLVIPAVVDPKRIINKDNSQASNQMDLSSIGEFEQEDDYKLSLNLFIEPLSKLKLESPTHNINVEYDEDINLYKVTFRDRDTYLDDEFVLLLKEKEIQEASGMIYNYFDDDEQKGILYLRLIPNLVQISEEVPRDYIFLIDVSESMKGEKLEEAKDALKLCIRNMGEEDRFNIVAFENELKYFSKNGKVDFNEDNIEEASKWIDNLEAVDGTAIYDALGYALSDEINGDNNTILLFTDDQIKKEQKILDYVKDNIRNNRIFTFGIETSEGSYFINKLAETGYGKAEYIYQDERIDDKVLRQFNRINNPQVDVLKIDWGNMKVERTFPRTIDYLYDGEPFSIFAKVSGEIEGNVTISGLVDDKPYVKTVNLDRLDLEENADLVQKVWSRKRMESIAERMRREKGEVAESMRNKIVEISKDSGIISTETLFILMEKVEEPILGMPFTHIIPLKITDHTQNTLSEDFLETPSFIYRSIGRETSFKRIYADKVKSNEQGMLRDDILRRIARNQYADGSFANFGENLLSARVEMTLTALLAFVLGKEDIKLYSTQLNKSTKFILKNINEHKEILSDRLLALTLVLLKAVLQKGVIKDNSVEEMKLKIEDINSTAVERKFEFTQGIIELMKNDSLKEAILRIFDCSTENIKALENDIQKSEEKNSIYRLSLLGIAKSI